jgi:endonuclease YncB( thermonuclease family)
MGFRFRKSIKILPGVRLNFSNSGTSVSVGPRGLRYTKGPRGDYITTGIPGTGISYTEKVAAGRPASSGSGFGAGAVVFVIAAVLLLVVFVAGATTPQAPVPRTQDFPQQAPKAAGAINGSEIRVTDGDTIFARGKVYRLVGFNAPETYKARCAEERALGIKADARLRALVNGGGLELIEVRCSCRPGTEGTQACNYGRSCAVLKAKGVDVGRTLIKEGLAEVYICGATSCPRRREWCP